MASKRKRILRLLMIILVMSVIISYIVGGINAIHTWCKYPRHRVLVAETIICISVLATILLQLFGEVDNKLENICSKSRLKGYLKNFRARYHMSMRNIKILSIVLTVGTIYRVVGFDWGQVAIMQPDEGKLVSYAIKMANEQSLYNENIYYPNQIVSKIAALSFGVINHIVTLSATEYYFIFRIIVALFGAAIIIIAFLIGNYFRDKLGICFSILVCCNPLYINLSKQVTGDITVLFFLTLVMLFSIRYIEKKREKFLLLMCLCSAAATLEKWHGAVGIGFVGILIIITSKNVRALVLSGIRAVSYYFLGMLVFAPNVVFNLKQAIIEGFINIAVYDHSVGSPFTQMLVGYAEFGISETGGMIYICALLFGCIVLLREWQKKYIFNIVGIIKIVCLCFLNRQFPRWGCELYFCEMFIVSLGIVKMGSIVFRNDKKGKRNLSEKIGATLLIIIITLDFFSAATLQLVISNCGKMDSRLVQRSECKNEGIIPQNTLSQYYSGYHPGGWIDEEYESTNYVHVNWNEWFEEREGTLYRKSTEYDYIVLNISKGDNSSIFERYLSPVFEYDTVCQDVFGYYLETEIEYNDIGFIINNISLIKNILNGALVGDKIQVYYVGHLPLL